MKLSAREAARDYTDRGWRVIPIPRGKKAPRATNWQHLRIRPDQVDQHFELEMNVGVLMGEPSGWLIDLDLDHPLAVKLADRFLPETGAVFGRKSKKRSHRLYRSVDCGTTKFQFGTDGMLVEVRSDGCQTVVPGSVHPSGEAINWERTEPPIEISRDELLIAAGRLAAATLLAARWPEKGTRDDAAMALAGTLLRGGWEVEKAAHFIEAVAEAGGDDEIAMRANKAPATAPKLAAGEDITGVPRLGELLGVDVVKTATKWLGLRGDRPTREEISRIIGAVSSDDPDVVNNALRAIKSADLNKISEIALLQELKKASGFSLTDLRAGLRDQQDEIDWGDVVATRTLEAYFADGAHLVRAIDRSWWRYTGTHWARTTDEQVLKKIEATVREIIPAGLVDYARTVRAAYDLLVARQAADDDVLHLLDEPPSIVNCQNGELWLDSGGELELRPHQPDSYLTYVLDVEYDPTAKAPLFIRTLLEIFRDCEDPQDPIETKRLARHFLELIGYIVQPTRNIATWWLLYGDGNNGKSKLIETAERLLNRDSLVSARMAEVEKDKFTIGSLAGKLLLVDDDVDANTRLPDGWLKKISERKPITGQLKFKDTFTFICSALPVMLANNWPSCADLSQGTRRRAMIIPFDRTFTNDEDDRDRFPRIWQDELAGVLNLALVGLRQLRKRGNFSEPACCKRARRVWLAAANPLVSFLYESGEVEFGATMSVSIKHLFDCYRSWAMSSGYRAVPEPRNTMRRHMQALQFGEMMRSDGAHVIGLRLKRDAF
jgi:P4 family phage/plasmid primase-like protien